MKIISTHVTNKQLQMKSDMNILPVHVDFHRCRLIHIFFRTNFHECLIDNYCYELVREVVIDVDSKVHKSYEFPKFYLLSQFRERRRKRHDGAKLLSVLRSKKFRKKLFE